MITITPSPPEPLDGDGHWTFHGYDQSGWAVWAWNPATGDAGDGVMAIDCQHPESEITEESTRLSDGATESAFVCGACGETLYREVNRPEYHEDDR
jgi:hypothetical protein